MLRYSKPKEWVLDQFLGSGTTLVEAKLLERNAIGVDVNPNSIFVSKSNLDFSCDSKSKIHIRQADARDLSFIKDESIDFICTHPPYANIIEYSTDIAEDISLLGDREFIEAMRRVALEAYRVLKTGRCCSIMVGDIRRRGCVVPLGFEVMNCFLEVGFRSKEIIIKQQHNCRATDRWMYADRNFLLLAHEYIFVFHK